MSSNYSWKYICCYVKFMLLPSLKKFNNCCEISCCKVCFMWTVSEIEFPNLKKIYQAIL